MSKPTACYVSLKVMLITKHISEIEMISFCSGILSAREMIMCAEHLEGCHECGQLFTQISKAGKYARATIPNFPNGTYLIGEHLDYDNLNAYLEGEMGRDKIDIVKIHLKLCSLCSEDLLSLKEFRKEIERELEIQNEPRSLVSRLVDLFNQIRSPHLSLAYGTMLISVLLGLLLLAIYFNRVSKPSDHSRGTDKLPANTPLNPGGDSTKKDEQKQPSSTPTGEVHEARGPLTNPERKMLITIYDRGKLYGLDYNGNPIGLQSLPADIRRDMADVLRGGQIGESKFLHEVEPADMYERGSIPRKDEIELVGPTGTLIREDRPVLKWRPIKEATSYVVSIVDEYFNPIAQSSHLRMTEWAVKPPLRRDAVYQWQVTAFKDKERIESKSNQIGKFKVISKAKLNEMEGVRKQYKSHLALGIYSAREGLLDDAEREFRKLLSSNPGSGLIKNIYQEALSRRKR